MLASNRARTVIVALGSVSLLALAGAGFWYEDLRYTLPTPRPPGLVQPPVGAELPVADWLRGTNLDASGRPVLLHFFNPECPCSRFNLDHLHRLHARFGDRVLFVGVIQAEGADEKGIQAAVAKLDIGIPYFIDVDGRVAAAAGVYSTPQAVLLDDAHHLAYRGNYNTSRYCTDPRTEFVRIALEGLVHDGTGDHGSGDVAIVAPGGAVASALPALPAYGCELPSNKGARGAAHRAIATKGEP